MELLFKILPSLVRLQMTSNVCTSQFTECHLTEYKIDMAAGLHVYM